MEERLMFFQCESCLDAYPYEARLRAIRVTLITDLNTFEPVEGGEPCFLCPTCHGRLAAGEKAEEYKERLFANDISLEIGGTDAEDD